MISKITVTNTNVVNHNMTFILNNNPTTNNIKKSRNPITNSIEYAIFFFVSDIISISHLFLH